MWELWSNETRDCRTFKRHKSGRRGRREGERVHLLCFILVTAVAHKYVALLSYCTSHKHSSASHASWPLHSWHETLALVQVKLWCFNLTLLTTIHVDVGWTTRQIPAARNTRQTRTSVHPLFVFDCFLLKSTNSICCLFFSVPFVSAIVNSLIQVVPLPRENTLTWRKEDNNCQCKKQRLLT